MLRIEKNYATIPSLIVCPASVVLHWEDELCKYFPETLLKPVKFSPTQHSQYCSNSVVIISYEMLRRDALSNKSLLQQRTWEVVVLDEAHLIKNPTTATAKVVFGLQSRHRIALTGTPIQNQVDEVWSLMNFLLPDYLGEFFFSKW